MTPSASYQQRLKLLLSRQREVLSRPVRVDSSWTGGWFERFDRPVLTAEHVPLSWRYDLNPETNPRLLERLGVNAVFNPAAIEREGKVILVCRVEGNDRKSFFALAESANGTGGFHFAGQPLLIPEADNPGINTYDMRLTRHEDGWTYGVFCVERKDPAAPPGDLSSAVAAAGIARTKDLIHWERLNDLRTPSPQQRNVVLHPKFVDGQYAFYTRPQDDFLQAGSGGGIGWGLSPSIEHAVIKEERIIHFRAYHTIMEVKNGMGGPPLETEEGWLHVAHGVRGTAAGLRYVLYAFLCDLNEPWKIIREPGGHLLAPRGWERVGDVSNVVFTNGMVERAGGEVLIYYAASDTRVHVARTSRKILLDYVKGTPPDPGRSRACALQRRDLIRKNRAYLKTANDPLLQELRNLESPDSA